ncbi:uncharacterized protein ACFDR9_000913 [Janthinobacterium sp. CG_23.3]|uniref:lysozyme inhibitor LprI family protein n=1 Tax=Janthinobacterium sp. CG_23.3 TaxID=3349634 RepID=UPI0038D46839
MALSIRQHLPCVVFVAAFLPTAQALSAGLDCALAKTATESAICVDEELQRLDSRLSLLYGKLGRAQPLQREALRQAQLSWLKARDRCGADTSCITQRYQERIDATSAPLRDAVAYQPDSEDRLALAELRQAVDAMRQSDPEFALEKVLRRMRIKTGTTSFSNVANDKEQDAGRQFPRIRPAGVTQDEWRALLDSKIDGGGENGSAGYTLVDLDGDGRRDLVLDSYVGGTGLFSYTSALRRDGGKFTGVHRGAEDDVDAAEGPGYLFSTNGRGANQSGHWIRLRGRVYAAYQVGYYGVDNIYLLRPLTVVGKVPKLAVHYRYQLAVPKIQRNEEKGTTTALDDALHAALTRALGLVGKERANDVGNGEKPLCPVPDAAGDDERAAYSSYGPGHYTYEIAADVPVWVGRQCYLGRLVDWFGGYSAEGKLYAQLWMRKPGEAGDAQRQTYDVKGVRAAIRLETSMAKVEGDNGA